jgi:hypothetical protein
MKLLRGKVWPATKRELYIIPKVDCNFDCK